MLDRHPFRTPVQEDVETRALPWRGHGEELFHGELHGEHDAARAQAEQFRGGVLVEAVHRVVRNHAPASASELGDESNMPTHDWQSDIEPFLGRAALFRADDGRGTEPEFHAGAAQLVGEGANPRDRRRRVAEERIEDDGRCARCRSGARVVEGKDRRDEIEARRGSRGEVQILRLASLAQDDEAVDHLAALGNGGHARPVATLKELVCRLLPQVIQRAQRNEERVTESRHIEIAECERGFAQPPKLLTQHRDVERTTGCRREIELAHDCHLLAIRGKDRLQWPTRGAEDAHIDARLSRPQFRRKRGVARTGTREKGGLRRPDDSRAIHHRDSRRQANRLTDDAVARGDGPDAVDREPNGCAAARTRRLESHAVADLEGRTYVDDKLAALVRDNDTEIAAAIVRMRARDVVATLAPAVHAAGETSTENLRERLDVCGRRCGAVARREAIEERTIPVRHRGDVLGTLLAPLHLEARHSGVGDVGEMIRRREITGRDEEPAIQLDAGVHVIEDVVLAARLRARSAIRAPLGDHPGHEALAAVGDAQRAVDERLEAQFRHGRLDGANVAEGVLACEHHAIDAELAHDARAAHVVHGHLRGTVHLEARIRLLHKANEPDVLHDGGVHAAIDRLAQEDKGVRQLGGLEKDVEREVDALAALVGEPAGLSHLIQRELRSLVARVVPLGAEVHRIGAVGERGANGIQRSGRSQQLGYGKARHHAQI